MRTKTTVRRGKFDYWGRRGSPVEERFWTKVEKTETCWIWRGALNSQGYGQIGDHGITRYAHRLSLEWSLGRTLRLNEDARHSCDNRPCVRPDHLLPGSRSDNMRDAVDRGRIRTGLTALDTQTIRNMAANGQTKAAIARMFHVGESTVRRAVNGKR